MLIIPAIDIKNGTCVRLTQGDFNREKVYSEDPVAIAKMWEEQGAKQLHIVDLDGAKSGYMKNLNVIKKIISNIGIPVQVGGGISDERTMMQLINLNVNKFILGSMLFKNETLFKTIIKKYQQKVIVALDIKNEKVMINGWTKNTQKNIWGIIKDLENLGLMEIMITDINCDGTLSSPNVDFYKKCFLFTKMNIIASGGVSSVQDIERLEKIGIKKTIVGKALYERKIKLC